MNVEHLISALEFLQGKVDRLFPDREILRVARLKFDQLLPDRLPHLGVGGRFFVGLFVNANQLGDRVALQRRAIEQIFPAVNDHAELRAPIADVIVADDFVAEKGGDPRERVAQDGAANVSDVHRLRHVRRTEIDHDALRAAALLDAEAFVAEQIGGLGGDRSGRRVKLMNPAPAIVGGSHRSHRSYASNIFWARARGFSPSCLARTSAALL